MKHRRVLVAALAASVVLAPTLGACSLQQAVSTVSGGNVDLGGTTLPKSFPAEVPLYNSDITLAAALGNDADGRTWNVSLRVKAVDDIKAIQKQLGKAGFTSLEGSDIITQTSDDGRTILVENAHYGVVVVVVKTNGDVIANYTVTQRK